MHCHVGALVKLSGPGSFHAAVHCATVSAAKRMRTNMGKRRRDGRPQLDHLRVSDSANSLDLDLDTLDPFPTSPSMNGALPPVAQQVCFPRMHLVIPQLFSYSSSEMGLVCNRAVPKLCQIRFT